MSKGGRRRLGGVLVGMGMCRRDVVRLLSQLVVLEDKGRTEVVGMSKTRNREF